MGASSERGVVKLINDAKKYQEFGAQQFADEVAPCVTGTRFGSGAIAVADPRVPERLGKYTDQYRVQSTGEPAATVTGSMDVQNGA
ncbi:hypothetical protein ACFRAM_01120 [Paenibacillus sp. NPDC056722]|uniref:hypothetical protein n=1 Tax=Paenibacillus sp. NPDC056722 TaxID=3345924 RepID=UPI0036930CDD